MGSKILFFGTPEFALSALEALVKNGYQVVAAVTRPDKPAGRKHILTAPPVKIAAAQYGIPVFQPERLEAWGWRPEMPDADLFIVAAYGKIILREILGLPRYGALNIHPSLLPRWRGPSPIQYTILHGDTETGVTIIKMDEKMDHGPIVAKKKWPIENSKPTYPVLHDQLAQLGAELLIETLPQFLRGEIAAVLQDETQATYSKILTREDGRIDWKKSAEEIERMVRAFHPWPGAWTIWGRDAGDRRIRIEAADAIAAVPPAGGTAGLVRQNQTRPLLIQSGRGSLAIKKIGIEGKQILDVETFIRGCPQIIGAILV